MRQRRAKIYRKMLHQYQLQFGFREPYQLLIDDTFSLALSRYKISDPLNQFSNVLQSKKVKPLITQCCMQVLYALGKEHQSTVNMAKEWERRMCNHREAIDPAECIKECVGKENKHRYIFASEKGELRKSLREAVAGLPMMHFTQAVMVLEPMSNLTKERIEEKEETKLSLPASEVGLLKRMPGVQVDIIDGADVADDADGEKVEGEGEAAKEAAAAEATSGGRRRKRKAPNPLSIRKSKNPRLTMEEKLKREAEFKKQKQRNAARARMEASKLPGKAQGEKTEGAAAGTKRKRRRGGSSNKDATAANAGEGEGEKKQKTEHQPKVNGNGENGAKPVVAAKPEGASKTRRTRTKKTFADGASATAAAAVAAAPATESSA